MNSPIAPRIPASAMDQFNYALRELGEQSMHFVIAFDGQIDEMQLKHACAATLAVVPVLGCRFVEADAPYWERITSFNADDLVRIHPSADRDLDLQKVLIAPIDPATSPPVRLDIIRSESRDTLCITVHHAAMDAHGLIVYAQLLASCYRDPGAWRNYLSPCPDRSLAGILSRFSLQERVPVITPPTPMYPGWAFPSGPGDGKNRAFAIRTLSQKRLHAIKNAARFNGATVNDLLLAGFFSALCDYIHPQPGLFLPIILSIDLRRYLNREKPAPDTMDTQASGAATSLPLDAITNQSVAFNVLMPTGTRSFDDQIREATAAMRVHKANNPGLASAIDIESFGYANFTGICERVRMMKEASAGTGANTPFLGNIGILPEASTDFSPTLPVIGAFIAGIVIDPPGVALGVTTFRDQLTLSIGYGCDAIPHDTMEGFMDTLVGYFPI